MISRGLSSCGGDGNTPGSPPSARVSQAYAWVPRLGPERIALGILVRDAHLGFSMFTQRGVLSSRFMNPASESSPASLLAGTAGRPQRATTAARTPRQPVRAGKHPAVPQAPPLLRPGGPSHVRTWVGVAEDDHELPDKGNGQHEAEGALDAHGEQARRMHPQYGRVS